MSSEHGPDAPPVPEQAGTESSEATASDQSAPVSPSTPTPPVAISPPTGSVPSVPSATATPLDVPDLTEPGAARAAVEAVLLVVDTPVATIALAQALDLPVPRVRQALDELCEDYDGQGRGFSLREVAGGWRLYTREEYAPFVESFLLDGQQTRLTQAALETLAVVAYRQPVTRARVAGIRGVGVDGVMRTLLSRGLVEECGTDPESGGGLYRTTPLFLEKLGLRSLEELPSLAPLLPEPELVDNVTFST